MKKLLCVLLLTVVSTQAFPQGKAEGQEIIDKFFDLYIHQGSEPAINYGFGTNTWMDLKSDDIKNLIYELDKNINLIGKYLSHEQMQSKTVGSRFRIVSYFVYYDRKPMRFTFQLYKNSQGWALWNFQFDSNWDDEVEEAMKLFRMKEMAETR